MRKWKEAAALTLALCVVSGSGLQAMGLPAESTNYTSVFDAGYYYASYPDLQKSIGYDEDKLLEHFITEGMEEGRTGSAGFNVKAYMKNNLDLLAAYGVNDLSVYYYHYIEKGRTEGRVATLTLPSKNTDELAAFSTQYDPKEDRAVNVELAAERINGIVVQPGETFSFSRSILSRTVRNGYVMAPSFAGGRVVKSVGGGICQVSSTLYVAMLLSSIPATERYAHSLQVDYVPEGLDSAIVEGVKDLRFRNPCDYPIKINSSFKDGTLTVGLSRAEDDRL